MRKKLEVIWSEESAKRTDEIVDYLLKKFSIKEATHFLKLLKDFEKIVSQFPETYPLSINKKGIRRAVIAKQISILYSIDDSYIRVFTLFDNRQDPKNIEFY